METAQIKSKVVTAIMSSTNTTNKVANGNFSALIPGAVMDLSALKADLSNLGDFIHYEEVTRRKRTQSGEWVEDKTPSTRAQKCPITGEELVAAGATVSLVTKIGATEGDAWPFTSLMRCPETTINGIAYGKEAVSIVEFLKMLAGKKWKCETSFDGVPVRGTSPRAYTIISM